jgi:hypothetical protein
MALEPWTSWPSEGLATAVERGTAFRMEAGEQRSTTLHALLWEGRGQVVRVTPEGVKLA